MTRNRWWAGSVGLVMALAIATPAHALVTFDSTVTDIECGMTSAAGTVFADCDAPSFYASVTAGQTAFLRATLDYHYTDDGLELPRPTAVQGDKFGFQMIPVTHEVGALYVSRPDCYRECPFPPNVAVTGTLFAPLMLGFNDVPDDITGSLPMFVQMSYPAGDAGGWTMTLSLTTFLLPISAPVPEPGTWALLGAGLLAGSFLSRRRGSPT
jgi:PEP-CTERM motif